MSAEAAVFYVFAAITVAAAAVVVLARSLIYSAFALLFTFFGVAGLYVLLGADFLAATQLLIYVGGILVLLLFGVMLTHKLYDRGVAQPPPDWPRAHPGHALADELGHGKRSRARRDHGGDRAPLHGQLPAPLRGGLRAPPRGPDGRGHDRSPSKGRMSAVIR